MAPIFAQWLDCVYQMLVQFPKQFEFSESLLISLCDHSYSNRFLTFLGNCERDRVQYVGQDGFWQFAASDAMASRFRNAAYVAPRAGDECKPLQLDLNSPAMLSIWKALYCRFFVRTHSSAISADLDTDHIASAACEVADEGVAPPKTRDHFECKVNNFDLTIIDDYCPAASRSEISLVASEVEDMSWSRLFSDSLSMVQTWIY